MNPKDAVRRGFERSFQFSGTATRAEFWWFILFVAVGIRVVDLILSLFLGPFVIIPLLILTLLLIIPLLSVGARRLHDINFSGWWQLLMLTIIGGLVLLVFWVLPTKRD